jgi:hypothetical protein
MDGRKEGAAMTKLIVMFILGIALVITAGQVIRSASTQTGPLLAQAEER